MRKIDDTDQDTSRGESTITKIITTAKSKYVVIGLVLVGIVVLIATN